MENKENKELTIVTESGEEILCEIIFTYYSEEFEKDYVFFAEKGSDQISVAQAIQGENGEGRLEPVTSDEEWTMLEDVLNSYFEEHQDEFECNCEDCHHEDCDCDDEDCCCDENCECHHKE